MFYNRIASEYSVESRKGFAHPVQGQFFPMSYGSHYAPFRNLETPMLDKLSWNNGLTCSAPADVLETDEQFIIELALPGVVLDDVQLKIEGNLLTVCAKRTPTLFEERAIILQKELPAFHMVRHFEFDSEIVSEQIEARLDRGILYISVPKMEVAMRIPVSAGMIENHVPNNVKTRVTSKHVVSAK